MSESSPGATSVTLPGSDETPDDADSQLSQGAKKALSLCLKAVAQEADQAQCGETLDALERLLPGLESSDIDKIISEPAYCAIRQRLLRVRAQTWFTQECELARRMLEHDPATALLSLFGDHIPREAYADELAVLRPLHPQKILILGSGACPMSAVVIQDAFPLTTVVGLDRSQEACTLSARLLAASSYSAVTIQHGEAQNPKNIGEFDCVIMALTIGVDEAEKRRIISELKTHANPDTVLAVRTAVAWGRVLYPAIDLPEIAEQAAMQHVGSSQQRSIAVPIRMGDLRA